MLEVIPSSRSLRSAVGSFWEFKGSFVGSSCSSGQTLAMEASRLALSSADSFCQSDIVALFACWEFLDGNTDR